jgi:putative hydrolase of the HAD superfamily
MIRAVTFDVGGTLIEPWPSVGHVYAEVAAQHGWAGLSIEALNREFGKAWANLGVFRYTKAEWLGLVNATFQGVIAEPAGPALFAELYEQFATPESWHVFKDVLPTLRVLSQLGLKLGIISNWDRRLGPLLGHLGLREFFDAVIISCYAGETKPSKVIYQKAVKRLRVPPEAILHVGDSLEADVEGARNAGLQSLWLRRGKSTVGRDELSSLRQVEGLLRQVCD